MIFKLGNLIYNKENKILYIVTRTSNLHNFRCCPLGKQNEEYDSLFSHNELIWINFGKENNLTKLERLIYNLPAAE